MSSRGYDPSVVYAWEKETSDWMEGKTFAIPEPHNCIPPPEKMEWNIETLCARLVERKLIPASIQFDTLLYSVLIAQMELQLLRNLVVPKGVGMGNFYRNVETIGLRRGKLHEEKKRCMNELEKWTGISMNHWHKIDLVDKKRKRETEKNMEMSLKVSFLLFVCVTSK